MTLRCAAATVGLAMFALALGPVFAQSGAYPARPIRFIVPYPPAGGTDTVARIVARRLSESLGQQVVIDNRGGANAIVGTALAAKAAPDGYTMVLGLPASLAVNPNLYRDLPYDPLRDFAPVSQVVLTATVITAHPGLVVNTVHELMELARMRPGQLNYGSSGNGSAAHLVLEQFKRMAKIDVVHIPYKGGGPAATDLMAGQIQLMGGPTIVAAPLVRSGKIKALAVSTAKRVLAMPDVPTIAETVPGFDRSGWHGILVPRGTPTAVIGRLSGEIAKVLQITEVRRQLIDQGADPVGSTPSQLAELMKLELEAHQHLLKAVGMYRQGGAAM